MGLLLVSYACCCLKVKVGLDRKFHQLGAYVSYMACSFHRGLHEFKLCRPYEGFSLQWEAWRRRRSLPGKQEYPENVPQNTPPTLPSYMAVSQSAKAKLRSQGSPRLVQDGGAENGFVRRHSLPSSMNDKIYLSPRVQKPVVQANGKGGSRSDKSLSASRDGNGMKSENFLQYILAI
ncbi:hypothetical protein RHMOL_Rhmol03G0154300 [Rhododendron molle]|uniref:Uncharacterized protein n=1 Tax=Rhododendron molle TaxID=49168 RepID=A0ACC0PG04_RHOML|nr:hypothetical protein RHMOL_Rhmol03G0154300 [Rhododendron molle]